MSTQTQKPLPKWFDGEIYNEGGEVTNPYTDQSMKLTAEELSMYDFIKGAEVTLAFGGVANYNKIIINLRRGLDWFRRSNPSAYMTLLD
jgi:hypothetical protein